MGTKQLMKSDMWAIAWAAANNDKVLVESGLKAINDAGLDILDTHVKFWMDGRYWVKSSVRGRRIVSVEAAKMVKAAIAAEQTARCGV